MGADGQPSSQSGWFVTTVMTELLIGENLETIELQGEGGGERGRVKEYDFPTLAVASLLRRSLGHKHQETIQRIIEPHISL